MFVSESKIKKHEFLWFSSYAEKIIILKYYTNLYSCRFMLQVTSRNNDIVLHVDVEDDEEMFCAQHESTFSLKQGL